MFVPSMEAVYHSRLGYSIPFGHWGPRSFLEGRVRSVAVFAACANLQIWGMRIWQRFPESLFLLGRIRSPMDDDPASAPGG